MRKRFADIIRSMRPVRCLFLLLVFVSLLVGGPSIGLPQTEEGTKKTKSRMALPGEKCRVDPLNKWTEPEQWAWTEICEGEDADFNGHRRAKVLNPNNPKREILDLNKTEYNDNLLAKRTISSNFLRTILLHEPFRSAIPIRGVRVVGAYFKEIVDLKDASIEWPLVLNRSFFWSPVYMHRFITSKFVSFYGSKFEYWIDMQFASIGGDLFMKNAKFISVRLHDAMIGNNLNMVGSTFESLLDMSSVSIKGDLFGYDESYLGGKSRKTEFNEVDLERAKIGGNLDMSGSTFHADFNLNSTSIEGNFYIGRSNFKQRLDMNSVAVGKDLFMKGAQFNKPVNLRSLAVGSNLDFQGATLSGLDLTGARIEGDLVLGYGCRWGGSSCQDKDKKKMIWKNYESYGGKHYPPTLSLRNANVGVLRDTKDAWPPHLELDGFTYKRFESINKKTLYERGSKWFIYWLAKDKSYSLQPYLHLAGILRSAGYVDTASDILYERHERQRKDPKLSWDKWLLLTLLKVTIGYGYGFRYFGVFVWVGFYVFLGTFILYMTGERNRHLYLISGKLDCAFYSLDMLLPVVRLREQHYTDVNLNKWVRYYFYFHQLAGYILIYIAFGDLSAITKFLLE